MRILHIMAGAAVGGAEIFCVDAIAALQQAGVEQEIILRPNNKARETALQDMGVPVHTASFNTLLRLPTSHKIRKTIRAFKPDIVHYWMSRAASFCVSGDHINMGWHSSYYDMKRYKKCDYQIGVTPDVVRHITEQGVPQDRAFSLPIYTQKPRLERVPPATRQELDTPEDAPLLLSLARLHPVKGLDILLRALVDIPAAYLWLAGSGELEAELKAQATELNLTDRVRFLGWREDKEALMAAADICAFPSRNDSFGAVMIEAWAQGKLLVATKAPGPRAYIRHGEDGLLVDIDDAAGFAQAVNQLLNDTALCDKLSQNGLQRYEAEFTQEAFTKNALAIYNDVLKR